MTTAAWHRAFYRAWRAVDEAERVLREPWCVGLTRHNWQAALARATSERTRLAHVEHLEPYTKETRT